MLELARDPDLLRIGRLAKQNLRVREPRTEALLTFNVRRRRFKTHDIQKRPRQVVAAAEIFQHGLDGGGKAERPMAKKQYGLSSNPGIVGFPFWRTRLNEFTPRRELHDQALKKRRRGTVVERGIAFLVQFIAASPDRSLSLTER